MGPSPSTGELQMTSLTDRPNTALLVIDMQLGVVASGHEVERVVGHIATLIDRARADGVAVVWVQHSDDEFPQGSTQWEYVPELVRRPDEPLVHKHHGDSFAGTDLEAVLAERRVGQLVVTGAQTDACIRSTLHGGLARGYDVTLVGDAHTTEDMREWGSPIDPAQAIEYTNLYWSFSSALGCRGGTVSTADVEWVGARWDVPRPEPLEPTRSRSRPRQNTPATPSP